MTVEYSDAAEVQTIAEKLIPKHHAHLNGAEIRYVFRSVAAKSKGIIILGKARKIAGLNAYFAGAEDTFFFVLEVAADQWKELNAAQRTALVDHELEHFGYDVENDTPMIRGHDVQEFTGIIRRHGLWRQDLEDFGKAVQEKLL